MFAILHPFTRPFSIRLSCYSMVVVLICFSFSTNRSLSFKLLFGKEERKKEFKTRASIRARSFVATRFCVRYGPYILV